MIINLTYKTIAEYGMAGQNRSETDMKQINWTKDRNEMTLESAIADRAIALAKTMGIKLEKFKLVMDLDATHCNGTPLKLEELLKADDANFMHDIAGIQSHIDRTTGKLTNCFLPRFAK
jgi:hypothetical protein